METSAPPVFGKETRWFLPASLSKHIRTARIQYQLFSDRTFDNTAGNGLG